MIKAKLKKLSESLDPLHPGNIEVGREFEGEFFVPPAVGECFYLYGDKGVRTSVVQKVLDETTFETYNSIYKLEVLEKK